MRNFMNLHKKIQGSLGWKAVLLVLSVGCLFIFQGCNSGIYGGTDLTTGSNYWGPESTGIVVQLFDGDNYGLSVDGNSAVNPSSFEMTFIEAMDDSTIVSAGSGSLNAKVAGDTGNITFVCNDGSTVPEISISKSETANYTYIMTVENPWKYALLDCTLTLTTGVKSADGLSMDENVSYNFTNGCAMSDDFNADSHSCWAFYPADPFDFQSLDDVLETGALEFDTADSALVFDDADLPEDVFFDMYKTVSFSSDGFEIILDIDAIDVIGSSSQYLGISVANSFLSYKELGENSIDNIAIGVFSGGQTTQVCAVLIRQGSNVHGAAEDCSDTSNPYSIRFALSESDLEMQYSTDGVTFEDMTVAFDTITASELAAEYLAPGFETYLRLPFSSGATPSESGTFGAIETSGVIGSGPFQSQY